MGALTGVTVLDLTRVLAGPWASQLLADLGADVVKVENPDSGDDTRRWGPPWTGDSGGESAYYLCANRGKRSITLDLKSPQGRAALLDLVAGADVLLENFKTGTTEALGIDYESLSAINPSLIYCSITGFGHTGPYRDLPGYDFMVQGMGGLMSVTGEANGEPQKVGVALSDILTGLYASNGILAALHERGHSGQGQHIDLALLDVTAACLANQATNYLVGGKIPTRMGNAHPNIAPYQSFATADGHIIVAIGNDQQFSRFCELTGQPEIAANSKFSNNAARVANSGELTELLAQALCQLSTAHWLSVCKAQGVPAGPINSIDAVFSNEQILARDMVVDMEHAERASLQLVGNPIKFSRTPVTYDRPPPLLGQHTAELDDVIEAWTKA